MVLDTTKFTPGAPLQPGTLWVGEQIPGHYVASDTTNQLERGYWPSYNVPYQPEIYNLSGCVVVQSIDLRGRWLLLFPTFFPIVAAKPSALVFVLRRRPSIIVQVYDLINRYPDIVRKIGPDASYDLAPRAKIFRRDQVRAQTCWRLLRSNED